MGAEGAVKILFGKELKDRRSRRKPQGDLVDNTATSSPPYQAAKTR
jgi:hypothetical protein